MNTLNSGNIERYSHFVPISSINSLLTCHCRFSSLTKLKGLEVIPVTKTSIKGILWLVDSVNGEIVGRFFLRGFLISSTV
jgi:hypothetical protein